MPALTVYRASAGSGKTFALARDFIRLIIRAPEKYQHILAVTFTNKATGEMKSRILKELHKLASGGASQIRQMIEDESGLRGTELQQRAGEMLEIILHNYSRFYIETIDRFFQRAIRAFTREIRLEAGFRVELEADRVLSEAVDELLHSLDRKPELLEWMASYARERVEEGRHWNLKNDIMELGMEINREKFQEKSHEFREILSGKDALKSYHTEMNSIHYSFMQRLSGYAGSALDILEKEGVEAGDFKHAPDRNIGRYFHLWAHGDYRKPSQIIRKSRNHPGEWVRQGSGSEKKVLGAYNRGLGECLDKCLDVFDQEYCRYKTAGEIKKYLHVLGLLNEISVQMQRYTREQGIFLLSDTSRFLYGIIDGNEAPFIYEKIGNHFHHYMIDEFQDTSAMQWKNFLPLIDNSLAYMRENLVVGDVKQSIYRWRNSDWEILSEGIQRQFSEDQLEIRGLDRNWRSRKNIVAFNNDFFSGAVHIYSEHFGNMEGGYGERIRHAYSNLKQSLPDHPEKEGGYVHMALLEADNGEWEDVVHRNLISHIQHLQDRGIQPSEIAILVRSAKDGKRVSDALLDHKSRHPGSGYSFEVVSNDSLFLEHAPSVRLILASMRYLSQPEVKLNLAELAIQYSRLNPDPGPSKVAENLAEKNRAEDLLPPGFRDLAGRLRYFTLTELTEKVIQLFHLESRSFEIPYLIAFQDLILDYSKNNPADLHSFLNWWRENGEKQALSLSEDQQAMRVMTIHKAKGLEFRAVIIPYCNWALDHMPGFRPLILWCNPAQKPFDRFPLVPVRYGKVLKDTIFRKDYEDEHFRVYMDHLNLLYVAMTRAKDALIVYGRNNNNRQLATVSDLIGRIQADADFPSCPGMMRDTRKREWIHGEMRFGKTGINSGETGQMLIRTMKSHPFTGKLRLFYRGTDFFDPEAEKRVHYGNLMHEVFSRINTRQDVKTSVERIRREGMIDRQEAGKIAREIGQILQVKPYREWFDGSWKVIAERDILDTRGAIKRPDRVMVKEGRMIVLDYKFGYAASSAHKQQVKQYMEILKQMRFPDVKGYVWYVLKGELVEV